ncbi:MAG: tetratricopeptide repeat protein [Alphaproteobacteria bacterium]
MIRFQKLFFIIILFSNFAFAQQKNEERMNAKLLYKTGLKSFSTGNYSDSSKYFSEFISRYSEEEIMQEIMPKAFYILGCSYYNIRKMEEAVDAFNEYLKIDPDGKFKEDVLFRSANAYKFLLDYSKAISAYEDLLEKFPDFNQKESVNFQIAICFLAQEKYKKAIPVLKKIVETAKNKQILDTSTAYLIKCFYLTGKYDDALKLVKKISKNSNHLILISSISLQLGDFFYEDFQYDKALDAYRNVTRKKDMLKRQKKSIAILKKYQSENKKLNFSELEQINALIPQIESQIKNIEGQKEFDTAWLMRLGRCLYEMGMLWESSIVFEEIKDKFPESKVAITANSSLIFSLAQMQLYDKTRKEIDEFIKKNPKNPKTPRIAFLKAETYINQENFSEAEKEFQVFINKYPDFENVARAEFYLHLSQAMQEKFDTAKAGLKKWMNNKKYLKTELADDVGYWYCMSLYFGGDYSNSPIEMAEFLEKFPKSSYVPDIEYRIASSFYMQEKYKDAALALVNFVNKFPDHIMIFEAHILRGDALAAMGELPIAVNAYSEAGPESGAQYHYAVSQMGKCYKMMEDYSNMVSVYEVYIKNIPNSPNIVDALYKLGWAHKQLGNISDARVVYWDALNKYGNQREWQGFADITKDLTKLYPGSNGLSELELKLKDESAAARAKDQLTLASRLDMTLLNILNYQNRKVDKLIKRFSNLYLTNLLGADGLIFLARNTINKKTETLYKQLVSEFPENPLCAEAELRLAQIELKKKNFVKAKKLLNSAQEKVQDMKIAIELTFEEAELLLADDMPKQAIKKYEEVLGNRAARGPLWPKSIFAIAKAHEQLKNFNKAIPYFQRIYVMYSGYTNLTAKAYLNSGKCFEILKDIKSATNTYNELIADIRLSHYKETKSAKKRLKELTK